ncbi:hypothetical protein HBE96_01865 [Clostridium sp. P21]|uniref:Uncharacterized protein n=1 Tax=Clostridium muellerianum TaxID=2716538 RepID=A0A7Y0EE61_9CLOT|nr:hypothetical protein [Clostridium muellerianum]NMM61467.1 hypothetical protein [Clostridium muellerianum]
MENEEKMYIDKKLIEKVRNGLSIIKMSSREKDIRKEAEKLFDLLDEEISINSLSLEERILKKMKETKNTDPDMNANLYILHRKLVNGQITRKQALEMFDMYVKIEPYETKMF